MVRAAGVDLSLVTLTRLIPSLRTSIPDPLDTDLWPEATIATTTDIVVSGLSLLRLVEVCGTPCVHSGSAVIPGSLGRPSQTHRTSVLVARVLEARTHESGRIAIRTDAEIGTLRLIWSETRIINRASTARAGSVLLARTATAIDLAVSDDVVLVDLPLDVRAGDLLAIPSRPEPAHVGTEWLSHLV